MHQPHPCGVIAAKHLPGAHAAGERLAWCGTGAVQRSAITSASMAAAWPSAPTSRCRCGSSSRCRCGSSNGCSVLRPGWRLGSSSARCVLLAPTALLRRLASGMERILAGGRALGALDCMDCMDCMAWWAGGACAGLRALALQQLQRGRRHAAGGDAAHAAGQALHRHHGAAAQRPLGRRRARAAAGAAAT